MNIRHSGMLYDETFYTAQMTGSSFSAAAYAGHLLKIFRPQSIADVGCGRGVWLQAFGENGVKKLVGFDGPWNSQEQMADRAIVFYPVDLNKPILHQQEKFDLAMSLEVAEHLPKTSARTFVESLTGLSDAVMFSAAYTRQGGTGHFNERPHTYWAKIFMEYGYTPYDIFRPTFWGNPRIEFWYQQNTFLYVKKGSELNRTLENAGYHPLANIDFMDCIHPELYDLQTTPYVIFKNLALKVIPDGMLPFATKIKRTIQKLTG